MFVKFGAEVNALLFESSLSRSSFKNKNDPGSGELLILFSLEASCVLDIRLPSSIDLLVLTGFLVDLLSFIR